MFTLADHQFMARAITLAKQGEFTVSPNPLVGCVIVKDNEVVGEGWHKKAGTGHAEVNAIKHLALEVTEGSTAYVTLEPCSHFGRTPPCSHLLVEKKVKRVVVACLDPNPLVSGKGIEYLIKNGVEVEVGLLEQDALTLNKGFMNRMVNKLPYIQIKQASSIDGKVALHNGQSKWITGSAARADVQKYRAKACAILTTASTVLADNASLNVRNEELSFNYPFDDVNSEIRQPKVFVLDGNDRLTDKNITELNLFKDIERVVVFKANNEHALLNTDVQCLVTEYEQNTGFNLMSVIETIGDQDINMLWVEAGGQLCAALYQQQLFDEYILYLAPKIMGKGAQDVLPIGPFDNMSQLPELNIVSQTSVGNDLKIVFNKK